MDELFTLSSDTVENTVEKEDNQHLDVMILIILKVAEQDVVV